MAIDHIPVRPREKLCARGPETLMDRVDGQTAVVCVGLFLSERSEGRL